MKLYSLALLKTCPGRKNKHGLIYSPFVESDCEVAANVLLKYGERFVMSSRETFDEMCQSSSRMRL